LGKIRDYFSLYGPAPVLGKGGSQNRSQIGLFFCVAAGACSKVVYDFFANAGDLGWKTFVVALIASVVIFPQLYWSGGLDKKKLSFAHWALAFQNGFFWSVGLAQLSKSLGG
jgi:hypothetical protein